uniref:Uncharacterized protein n=1 Tax=Brassica oleracea var. oleracea TaxID=109376 RepID=A0A0D3DG72_BRAOL
MLVRMRRVENSFKVQWRDLVGIEGPSCYSFLLVLVVDEVSLGKFIFECMVEHSLLKLGYHSSAFCLLFRGYILALRVCVMFIFWLRVVLVTSPALGFGCSEVGALHSSTLSFTEEHMAENVKEHGDGSAELVKSMGDNKYASLMRPAGRYYSAIKDVMVCGKGRYTLVKDVDDVENGVYDKPLPCFGCNRMVLVSRVLIFVSELRATPTLSTHIVHRATLYLPAKSYFGNYSHSCGTIRRFSILGTTTARILEKEQDLLLPQSLRWDSPSCYWRLLPSGGFSGLFLRIHHYLDIYMYDLGPVLVKRIIEDGLRCLSVHSI